MLNIAPDALAIEPDADQLGAFVRTLFKHASSGGIVSLRAFPQNREGKAIFIRNFEIEDDGLDSVITGAITGARAAAKAKAVFSPPVAVFKDTRSATERNIAEAVALSVECDERAAWARQTLTGILGAPTLTVASGGIWIDPETGEVQDKLHLHWRLAVPARDAESLALLKLARTMACDLVGADRSCIPASHPLRWAGSLHLKAEARLCRIVETTDNEIDLAEAFALLREVTPADARREPGKFSRTETLPQKEGKVFPNARAEVSVSGISGRREASDHGWVGVALAAIPNDDPKIHDWEYWNWTGMTIWASTDGSEEGRIAFHAWSAKSKRNDPVITEARWQHYSRSPPTKLGFGSLVYRADQHVPGWRAIHTATLLQTSSFLRSRK